MEEQKHLAYIEVIVDPDPESENPNARKNRVCVAGEGTELLHALAVLTNQLADEFHTTPMKLLSRVLDGCESERASRKEYQP